MIYLHPPAYPHVWLWESPSLLARDWPLSPVGHVGQGGWWGWTRHHLRSQNNLGCNTTGEMCFLVSRWTAWAECAVKHPKHKDSEITDTRTSLAHAPSHTTAHGLDRWWKLRLPIRSCARTTCFELFIGPSDFTWLCLTDSKTKRFLCYYVSGWVKTGTVVAVASYKHKLQTIQMWNKVSTLSSRIHELKSFPRSKKISGVYYIIYWWFLRRQASLILLLKPFIVRSLAIHARCLFHMWRGHLHLQCCEVYTAWKAFSVFKSY